MRAKFDYYRSQKHLRNVAALDCQSCGRGGPSQAAHSNKAEHGKCMQRKASDIYTAALCPRCHDTVDNSYTLTREQREAIWHAAWRNTRSILVGNGQWPEVTIEDIPRSSLEQEYDLATYGDWMSDENQQ